MVFLRSRARTLETLETPKQTKAIDNTQQITTTNEGSGYEQSREKRIKENMERMQKLGILDLSFKLKSEIVPRRRPPKNYTPTKTPESSPFLSSQPTRRSSRLQNVTPVSYTEMREKKRKSMEDVGDLIEEGSKPEIYTEEHEKLLGSTEASWTLFVDGCGKDGRRIYDSVKGKTCHQCRQKTLGHRTHCCKCNMVQGQFCGDCLYMRYGEHVLEANKNPNWICPVCRGICNCSLCRQAKGWQATGAMYKKITRLGFKSVAHYLIQTRRAETISEDESSIDHSLTSARRSLPFTDMKEEEHNKDLVTSDHSQDGSLVPPCFEDKPDETKLQKEKQNLDHEHSIDNIATESAAKSIGKLVPST